MNIFPNIFLFTVIWYVSLTCLFASVDLVKSDEYSSEYDRDSLDIVDRLLKRIAWDQVSISDSDSEGIEEFKTPSSPGQSSGTDEYLSARQYEELGNVVEGSGLSNRAPSSLIRQIIDRLQLVPLKESKYWRNNPNSLPYSQCLLTDSWGNWEVGIQASLVYGQFFHKLNGQTLFCYSDLEKTAFMIPIENSNGFTCGLSLTFAPYRKISSKLVKLTDQSADQIFGTYIGMGGGLGIFASLSGAVLKNRNNSIELHVNSFFSPGSFDFSVAYKKVEIRPRSLFDYEVYQLKYLHRLEKLRKARQAIEGNQFIRQSFQRKILKQQTIEVWAMENYEPSKRFASMADYWIHTLASNFTEELYFSPPDLNLLSRLTFIKRKKL
ncbi:MAG: hypothetical protein AB8G05_03305 [Oligoflexales bacterium]